MYDLLKIIIDFKLNLGRSHLLTDTFLHPFSHFSPLAIVRNGFVHFTLDVRGARNPTGHRAFTTHSVSTSEL
jgi:hypothetical protein